MRACVIIVRIHSYGAMQRPSLTHGSPRESGRPRPVGGGLRARQRARRNVIGERMSSHRIVVYHPSLAPGVVLDGPSW